MLGKAEHMIGNRVAVVVVVEEPGVKVAFTKGRLDGSEIHGPSFYLLGEYAFFLSRREGLRSCSKYESRGAFANAHQIRDGLFGIHFGGNAQEPAEAFLDHVIAIVEEDVRELKPRHWAFLAFLEF